MTEEATPAKVRLTDGLGRLLTRRPDLREESWLSYGTRLRCPTHGICRVRNLYPNRLSAIIGDVGTKPVGALADVWFRLTEDGRVWDWIRDVEVDVLDTP